jgi:hypothetical protein
LIENNNINTKAGPMIQHMVYPDSYANAGMDGKREQFEDGAARCSTSGVDLVWRVSRRFWRCPDNAGRSGQIPDNAGVGVRDMPDVVRDKMRLAGVGFGLARLRVVG